MYITNGYPGRGPPWLRSKTWRGLRMCWNVRIILAEQWNVKTNKIEISSSMKSLFYSSKYQWWKGDLLNSTSLWQLAHAPEGLGAMQGSGCSAGAGVRCGGRGCNSIWRPECDALAGVRYRAGVRSGDLDVMWGPGWCMGPEVWCGTEVL